MKNKLLLFISMLAVNMVLAQTYQQTDIELNSEIPKDKSVVYEASASIKMLEDFKCNPDIDRSAVFSIDRFGVFPPNEGIVGGPPTSNQDGVVGALPGELNVNDLGAAVYSIPILVPHGIGNMTPEIAVTYNNQSKNGLLGWGWHLTGLSSIVRTGQTLYHDNNHSAVNFVNDRFVMDGKRLMLCSGTYGANGSVYKTEIDEMSRIVAYSDGYDGPARFMVYKKDGTIWEYGFTNDSRVEPQHKNNVALMWLVNKITDPDGNAIVFNYYENQSAGESYISSIDYTLNDKAGITSMYQIAFEYDDREDAETGYVYANMIQKRKILRNIIVKNMMSGAVLYDYSFDYLEPGNYSDDVKFMYNRLAKIGLTANGSKINPTIINWNKKTHYPNKFQTYTLNKNSFNIVPFVGDFNGDGYSDVLTVPYKLSNTYSETVCAKLLLNNRDGSFDDNPYYTFNFDKNLEWVYIVDFNGDGLDDVVPYYVNYDNNADWKSKFCIYINNGNSFTLLGEKYAGRYFTLYPGDFCAENKASFFIEYNNEGCSNIMNPIIVYFNNNAVVSQSLGSQAYADVPERIVVEDVNGDGAFEIIYLMTDKAAVCKLTHEANHFSFSRMYYDNNIISDDFLFPGDFNGDGYTDFLKYGNKKYWEIVMSDGYRLTQPVSCLNNNLLRGLTLAPQDRYVCSLQSISIPSETIRTIDFDGDGKTDVGVFKSSGGNYYLEVGFNVFNDAENSCNFNDIRRYYLNINHSHQFIHVGNFLGHENASILGSVRSNPYNNEIPKIVSLNPHSAKFSVERITDGLGNIQGLSYDYLMPGKDDLFYSYVYQWVGDDMRTISIPVKALCSDTTYSDNDNPRVKKYRYKNIFYHTQGHGLLGAERIESKLLINNAVAETNVFEKDVETMMENYVLLPKTKLVYNSSNNLICREQYVYRKCQSDQNEKVIMPLLTVKKVLNYDCDKPNSLLKTRIENIEYQSDIDDDNYNNMVNVSASLVGFDENYSGDYAVLCDYWTETEVDYDNDIADWIVSRPKTIRTLKHNNNNESVGTCDVFDYSGSHPYRIIRKTSLPNANMDYTDPLMMIEEFKYDAVGHTIEKAMSTPSATNQKVTKTLYGPEYNYRYPTLKVNENGWETFKSYDNDYGNLSSVVDYNQFATNCDADPFEITTETLSPDGVKSVRAKRWAQGNKHSPQMALYYLWEKTTGNAETMAFYNKNGKKLREVTFGLNGEAVYVDMTYDDYGNLRSKSMPYKSGDDVNNYYYIYDKNNRLAQEVYPNGMMKYYHYDKFQTTVYTESSEGESRVVMEVTNAVGWRTRTVDIGGNTINYEYYSDGKLKNAMIGNNPKTRVEYEYDNRRNMVKIKDLSSGETSYTYNAFGELKEKRTANNAVTTYDYDNMGNVVGRTETNSKARKTVATRWIYTNTKGKIGTLSKIIYGDSHSVSYNYDNLLRITDVSERIKGGVYTTQFTYDDANRVESVAYPSDIVIQKKYSNSGYYKAMVNMKNNAVLWNADDANAMGYIVDYHYGNGLTTHKEFDDKTNNLKAVYTSSDDLVYQDNAYSYDDFGKLTSRVQNNGTKLVESFKYDRFNRLEEIRLNNVLTGVMSYDNYGNIRSKTNDGNDVFYEAEYGGISPYAVSKVTIDNEDLTGINQVVEYTAFDKLSYVHNDANLLTIEYGYNHDRVYSMENSDGIKKEKVYVSDCEFVVNNGERDVYTYLKGPMGVFAVSRSNDKGENSMFYIHTDHLNSWCLITDEDGDIVQKTSYDAWGNPRNYDTWSGRYDGELLCDRGFTGHEHLSVFGIINMNGRAYDPMLSMMMSPDNYIQTPDFSQNFNRYIYCFNNPLSYCDPSGEWVEWLLYGIFNGTVNVICNLQYIDNYREGALAFGAGFVYGCLTRGLSECSWAWQVAGNITGTTLKNGVNSFVQQNTGDGLDWSIIENQEFKTDVMYALGSSIAKSVLTAYVVQPTGSDDGKTIANMLCKEKYNQKILETATKKMVGNIFAGKKLFEGFGITKNNMEDALPYLECALSICADNLEYETSSATLVNISNKLLNFDFKGFMSKFGNDMDYCYSQFRSLFVKIGG